MSAYVGRFAPSPTGPLHFGSLIAATASYLQARQHGGRWLLRIEDLDPPREMPGAGELILASLRSLGFVWDGELVYQSRRQHIYQQFLDRLIEAGHVYPCACTRAEIADSNLGGPRGPVYPGTCREGLAPGRRARALRVRSDGAAIDFIDAVQGVQCQHLAREVGDFVVRRADGLFSYQLAVVIDDALQGVTEVVRGADLLDSTARQIHLQNLFKLPTPAYLHLPVAVNHRGEKLSKQMGAPPLRLDRPAALLCAALAFLGQRPPPRLREAGIAACWQWAIAHWDPGKIPPFAAAGADVGCFDFGYHDFIHA